MKLSIKTENYGITLAPKLNKGMFEYFWSKKMPLILNSNPHISYPIESVKIRINQALSWMDYHFYVTINNDVETEHDTFHIQFNENEVKRYLDSKKEKSIMFEDYKKGFDSKKWNFYSNILGYRLSDLNKMFNLG